MGEPTTETGRALPYWVDELSREELVGAVVQIEQEARAAIQPCECVGPRHVELHERCLRCGRFRPAAGSYEQVDGR